MAFGFGYGFGGNKFFNIRATGPLTPPPVTKPKETFNFTVPKNLIWTTII